MLLYCETEIQKFVLGVSFSFLKQNLKSHTTVTVPSTLMDHFRKPVERSYLLKLEMVPWSTQEQISYNLIEKH